MFMWDFESAIDEICRDQAAHGLTSGRGHWDMVYKIWSVGDHAALHLGLGFDLEEYYDPKSSRRLATQAAERLQQVNGMLLAN